MNLRRAVAVAVLAPALLVADTVSGSVSVTGSSSHTLAPAASASAAGPRSISAYFVYPKATMAENAQMLRAMRADAITFGPRLLPATGADLPAPVQRALKGRRAYVYGAPVNWGRAARHSSDGTVRAQGRTFTIIRGPGNTAFVTRSGTSPVEKLIDAGNRVGAHTIVGLPSPKAGNTAGVAWMPDTSYLSALSAFTQRYVRHSRALGADGYYQHVESPVTDSAYWAPVRELYRRQNVAVNRADPGARVLLSPFLESRPHKAYVTPAQAGRGIKLLLATRSGTDLVIAPQDGLGTGTTALWADKSKRVASLETYLRSMRKAGGSRLWVNIELMRPDGYQRKASTRSRVSQQLWTVAPYGSRTIAFMWEDPSRKIGARYVKGGSIASFSRGFATTGQ